MGEYGSSISWMEILFTIFVTGILYLFCLPLLDTLISIGTANIGTDPNTITFLHDVVYVFFPIAIVFSIIAYSWRRSGQERVA